MLILGGTSEARALASALVTRGLPVVSSLAGRVARPRLPVGEVRIGGFGGPEGLSKWLTEHRVRALVDATHPFAERIGTSAATAADDAGVPLLRLERPGWQPVEGADWRWADSLAHAAQLVGGHGEPSAPRAERVFLTSGRQGLHAFADLSDQWFLIRCVDRPKAPLPPQREVLLARGPYTLEGETSLMREHRVDLLVTKDSGGELTIAKLHAARDLGIPIVVIRRPVRPETERVADVDPAIEWVLNRWEQ